MLIDPTKITKAEERLKEVLIQPFDDKMTIDQASNLEAIRFFDLVEHVGIYKAAIYANKVMRTNRCAPCNKGLEFLLEGMGKNG